MARKKSTKNKLVSKFPKRSNIPIGSSNHGGEKSDDEITSKHINVPDANTVKEMRENGDGVLQRWLEIEDVISNHTITRRGPHPLPNYASAMRTVKFEDTGLIFTLGKVLKPRSVDLDYAITLLIENEALDEELLPDGLLWSMFYGDSSYYVRRRYLWRVIEMIGVYVDRWGRWNYPFTPEEMDTRDYRILAAVWVIQCFDHMVNYGHRPRPYLYGIAPEEFAKRTHVLTLTCPFCNKRWDDTPPKTPAEIRFMKYILWLLKHGVEFHKWNTRVSDLYHQKRKKEQ